MYNLYLLFLLFFALCLTLVVIYVSQYTYSIIKYTENKQKKHESERINKRKLRKKRKKISVKCQMNCAVKHAKIGKKHAEKLAQKHVAKHGIKHTKNNTTIHPLKNSELEEIQPVKFVCPLVYACRMLTSSSLFIFNILHGYYNGLNDCSTWILLCWINSLNYWRYPVNGIRRNIDLVSAVFATYHHYCVSYEILGGYIYRIGIVIFGWWYCMALYFGRIVNNNHYSSFCHVNIHCTAIIFNLWLFSQLYVSRNDAIDDHNHDINDINDEM